MTEITVTNASELSSAIAAAQAGDIILLQNGNYGDLDFTRDFSDYVTIRAITPGGALFDDVDVPGGSFVRFDGIQSNGHVLVDGGAHHVEFLNSKFHGLFANTVNDVRLENNDITNIVTIRNSSYVDVVENDIHDVPNDLLQVLGDSHHILIENNTLRDAQVTNSNAHPDLIQFFADFSNGKAPHDVTIRGNLLYDDPATGAVPAQGIFISDPGAGYRNILIEDNLIGTTGINGLTIHGGIENVVIQNNTLTGGRLWIAEVLPISNAGVLVQNNVASLFADNSSIGGGATVQNNLFYNGQYTTVDLFESYVNGSTWEQFLPKVGGPIDFGTGLGAWQRLQELQAGSGTGNRPDAVDDSAAVVEDASVTITGTDLLSNDSDPDGDPLTITAVSNGANGTAVLNGDGSVTYTPDADFFGQDSFQYTITDGNGNFDTATVTVDVSGTPDAPTAVNDTVSAKPDTATILNVLGNDYDPDGDPLQVTAVTQGTNGSVAINGDGTLTYTPNAGFLGADSFSYTVSDGNGGTDTASVTLTVSPFPTPVFDLLGAQSFSGAAGDVINLPHDAGLEISQATIAFSFTADDVNATQGLLSKDANGFSGGGNHLALYVEQGSLKARLQNGSTETILSQGGLSADQEYEVAATFGSNGVQLYLDGVLVASNPAFVTSWATNQEYLQIGGLGWMSQTGDGEFGFPFAGEIRDVQIYDEVLDASQIGELASGHGQIIGTAGDDTLVGTSSNDEILGLGGNDTLTGAGGDDTVDGGAGDDLIVGGSGAGNDAYDGGADTDTVTYESTTQGVTVNLLTGTASGTEIDTDTLTNIENVIGGFGDDVLTGDGSANRLEGRGGNDTLTAIGGNGNVLRGGSGDDILMGGFGNDVQLQGNAGADSFTGGTGADDFYIDAQDIFFDGGGGYDRILVFDTSGVNITLAGTNVERVIGDAGNDTVDATGVASTVLISGVGGNDTLTGGDAADQLDGGAGNDILTGGGGGDVLFGGAGADSFNGGSGDDRFFADSTDLSFAGGAGFDRLFIQDTLDFTLSLAGTDIERVNGNDGNDVLSAAGVVTGVTLAGGNGNDTLTGGDGNDVLAGDAGADILAGGAGTDSLFGGAGGDTFVFGTGTGFDFLVGWDDGLDMIDFSSNAGVNSMTDLTITDNGANVRVEFGGDTIVLIGATGQIEVSDFLFV